MIRTGPSAFAQTNTPYTNDYRLINNTPQDEMLAFMLTGDESIALSSQYDPHVGEVTRLYAPNATLTLLNSVTRHAMHQSVEAHLSMVPNNDLLGDRIPFHVADFPYTPRREPPPQMARRRQAVNGHVPAANPTDSEQETSTDSGSLTGTDDTSYSSDESMSEDSEEDSDDDLIEEDDESTDGGCAVPADAQIVENADQGYVVISFRLLTSTLTDIKPQRKWPDVVDHRRRSNRGSRQSDQRPRRQ